MLLNPLHVRRPAVACDTFGQPTRQAASSYTSISEQAASKLVSVNDVRQCVNHCAVLHAVPDVTGRCAVADAASHCALDGVTSTLSVCLLSRQEAGRLEHWGIWPKCKMHRHVNNVKAKEMVESGECRFLGGEGTEIGTVSMIVPNHVSIWKPVPTAGMIGLRTWGLARSK